MPLAFDSVVQEAMILPPNQRLALARQLLVSVEPEAQPDVEAAWDQEIRRRIARLDAGEAETVSAEEVFARVREIAPDC